MLTSTEAPSSKFTRDGIAWMSYLMIGAYCYCSGCLGPAMTFLRSEMHLSYTMTSYHFSAISFGVVIAGATGERWMRMLGKSRTVWFACTGLVLAIGGMLLGKNANVTIGSAFMYGLCGSTMSVTMLTLLANRFKEMRALAITEANIAASLCCSLAPLAISGFSRTTLGWRCAYLLAPIIFLLCFLRGRQAIAAASKEEQEKKAGLKGTLPLSYWICWLLIFLSVASEWTIVYWTADFMEKIVRLSPADAAASVSSFLTAMVVGRIIGSRLAREMKAPTLLRGASILALSGFILFWLNTNSFLCVLGLFLTGLGVSNFYPLTLSLAIGRARGLTNLATARLSMAAGSSTLIAPLLLGIAAEQHGIFKAYGLVAFLLALCCVMIFLPLWSTQEEAKN